MSNVRNLLYMASVQLVNYVFPIITIPIISRVFGPGNIGIINYIAAIVGYFTLFVNYSFNYTGVRWLTRKPEDRDKLFWCVFLIQLAIFICCTLFFYFLVLYFEQLNNNFWLCWVSYSSCLAALFTQTWFLQSHSNFKVIALISFLSKFISFILIIVLIKGESDLIIYSSIINFITLLTSLFIFIYSIIKYKIKFIFPSRFFISCLFIDGRYIFLSSIVTNIYTTTGIVILGLLSTKVDVGFYTSAQKLMDVSKSIILMPISQIIFPILSKKFGQGRNIGLSAVKKILPVFILISISFLVFINVFNKIIVIILFGNEFLPIIPMVSILSFGLFFVFFGVFIGGQVMLNLGMDRAFLNIQVFIAIFSLSINTLFVSNNGGLVTSIVWTVSEFIITFYQVVYLYRNGIKIFSWNLISINSIIDSLRYILRKERS